MYVFVILLPFVTILQSTVTSYIPGAGLGYDAIIAHFQYFQFVKRAHTLALRNDDVIFDADYYMK